MLDIIGLKLTLLKQISTPGGDVLHAMKSSDPGFAGFGEAYFSFIEPGAVKAWKRHRDMTLNLVVPIGSIRFVIFDDRYDSPTFDVFNEVVLSRENYHRLTVPPMLWMGFQCVSAADSMLLNIANITHEYNEADRKQINEIEFDWRMKL